MMQLSFDKQVQKIIKEINALPSQVSEAAYFAINRTADFLKSHAAQKVSADTRLKLKIIRDKIRLMKATRKTMQAILDWNIRGIYARDIGIMRQTKVGVKVGTRIFPHAFIAKLRPTSREGVYKRKTKKRFPLERVEVPIEDEARRAIEKLLTGEARVFFNRRFEHEIKRITGAV